MHLKCHSLDVGARKVLMSRLEVPVGCAYGYGTISGLAYVTLLKLRISCSSSSTKHGEKY